MEDPPTSGKRSLPVSIATIALAFVFRCQVGKCLPHGEKVQKGHDLLPRILGQQQSSRQLKLSKHVRADRRILRACQR